MGSGVFILNVIGMEYPRGYVIDTHAHEDYFQLYYMYGGEASWRYAERVVPLSSGAFLLVPPKVAHGLLPVTAERAVVLDLKFKIEDRDLERRLLSFGMVTQSCSGEEQSLFRLMFTSARNKGEFYLDILGNLLSTVLCLYVNQNSEQNERQAVDAEEYTRLSECTKRVLSFIEGGVMTCDFSRLDVIAANLDYNKAYMSRRFSQEIGMSITKYLQVLRIDKAKELLLETDYDINHISGLLNYRSVSQFISTFKRYLGTTPEKFRRTASRENALRYSFRIHDIQRDG